MCRDVSRSLITRLACLRSRQTDLLFGPSNSNVGVLVRLPARKVSSSDGGKQLTVNKIEPDTKSPRWQRRPDTRRAEILDGAVLAFGQNGYKRATLADVAEYAGVSAGTVSHYFGSKARLFEEVIAERLMPYRRGGGSEPREPPGPDARPARSAAPPAVGSGLGAGHPGPHAGREGGERRIPRLGAACSAGSSASGGARSSARSCGWA